MRSIAFAVLLGVFGVVGIVSLKAESKPEQELIKIENDWCAADAKQDAAVLGSILADDFSGVGSRGGTDTKASALASYKDQSRKTTSCALSNIKVRIYGDAAVVTGMSTVSGTRKGVAFKDRQNLWTDTFIRRNGRWQCVASQSTLIGAQQK